MLPCVCVCCGAAQFGEEGLKQGGGGPGGGPGGPGGGFQFHVSNHGCSHENSHEYSHDAAMNAVMTGCRACFGLTVAGPGRKELPTVLTVVACLEGAGGAVFTAALGCILGP